jgi:hypothetical protein
MNDDPMYRGPILDLYTMDDHLYCYLPSDITWPTMLGLLTIISDAIAASPWWGDGSELPWPDPDEWYAQFNGTQIDVVSTYRSIIEPDVVAVWLDHEDNDPIHLTREEFWASYRPAAVVPTPTADDWIDPAVRLPDVGEWVWMVREWGEVAPFKFRGNGVTVGVHRWAPILVGPPPIPTDGGAA